MKPLICVSQKSVCAEDFFIRAEKIFQQQPFAFILREKELTSEEYKELVLKLLAMAKKYPTPLFLNGQYELACELGLGVQISFQKYKELAESLVPNHVPQKTVPLGISIHSAEEAEYIIQHLKQIPVSHILAGHIFATDCKKGLAPRGLDFLAAVCKVVSKKIPVFGIGGISPQNMPELRKAGASGGAVMSSCMKTSNIEALLTELEAGFYDGSE